MFNFDAANLALNDDPNLLDQHKALTKFFYKSYKDSRTQMIHGEVVIEALPEFMRPSLHEAEADQDNQESFKQFCAFLDFVTSYLYCTGFTAGILAHQNGDIAVKVTPLTDTNTNEEVAASLDPLTIN